MWQTRPRVITPNIVPSVTVLALDSTLGARTISRTMSTPLVIGYENEMEVLGWARLAATLPPGSAALCILVRQATPNKVLAEVAKCGGKVVKTSLSHENEAKLQAALDTAQKALP